MIEKKGKEYTVRRFRKPPPPASEEAKRLGKWFVKWFNREFAPPFLPERFAKASIIGDSIEVVIGRRDAGALFDWTPTGSGTHLASKWIINEVINLRSEPSTKKGRTRK